MNTKAFNVKLLYAYKFVGQCLPIYAFYTLLFLERGMAVNGVALLVALWSVFEIAFEVPSGVLADRWNRRNMLALSAALQGLCFLIWFFAHSFLMFAIGFVFWGISGAFDSGTEESLIFDNLKYDGREEDFAAIYGRAQFFANAGALTGIASAGVMASFISIGAIALISAAACLINAIIALFLREKNYYAEKEQAAGFFDTLREAGAFLRRSRVALVAVVFLVLFASLGSYMDEFDALIIEDFGLGGVWVSGILTVRLAFAALGNLLAPKLRGIPIGRMFLVNGLSCGFLLLFAWVWKWYAILFFGISCMLMSVAEVLLVDAMQNEIKEEGRATVASFYGLGQNVAMICFSLIYALLSGIFTLQQTYMLIALYGIAGWLGFFAIKSRRD